MEKVKLSKGDSRCLPLNSLMFLISHPGGVEAS